MLKLLPTAALLLAMPALADDSLRCELARGEQRSSLSAPLVERNAEVKAEGLDASLGSSSWLVTLDNPDRKTHAAFAGSARGVTAEASSLSVNGAAVRCGLNLDAKPSLAPPPSPELPDYFVCVVDEAHFVKGQIAETKRHLLKATTPLASSLPLAVSASDAGMAFDVTYVSFDPFRGLTVRLADKVSGESVSFSGPARTLLSSFLIGLTIGDRAVDARFLRLGCVWTDDPEKLK